MQTFYHWATAAIFDMYQVEQKRIDLWQNKIFIRLITSNNTVYIIVDVTSPIVQDHRRQGKANMYYSSKGATGISSNSSFVLI